MGDRYEFSQKCPNCFNQIHCRYAESSGQTTTKCAHCGTEFKIVIDFKLEKINQLPNNMPVRYDIYNKSGNINYIGSAKKGRVRKEIASKIAKIPGAKVKIHQHHRIREARKEEANVIKRNKPHYNKLGK